MSNWNQGKSLSSKVRSIIWMGGLAILFMRGSFWPDILILIVISMVADLVIKMFISGAVKDADAEELPEVLEPLEPIDLEADENLNDRMQRIDPEPESDPIPPLLDRRIDRLPNSCPSCGAPLTPRDVEWLSEHKVKCGFCGTHLTTVG